MSTFKMSTKKSRSSKAKKHTQANAEPEVFVLPPDILQKLGINLGNIVSPKEELPAPVPEHVAAVHTLKPEVSGQSTKTPPKEEGRANSKKRSSILETAILMKRSVFLSPTFIPNGSYIPGELEMSMGTEIEINESISPNIERGQHNVNVQQKVLDHTPHLEPMENEVDIGITTNNSKRNNAVSFTKSEHEQPIPITNMHTIGIPSSEIDFTDDHPDEAYLSDCSSTNSANSSPSQNITDSTNVSQSHLEKCLKLNAKHCYDPDNKIKILSSEKLTPTLIKELTCNHVQKTSDLVPIPVNAVIAKSNLHMMTQSKTSTNSVKEIETEVFNEIDAAQQLIELADIINVSSANMMLTHDKAMNHMIEDTEKLCLDSYMMQSKPDMSSKVQDETQDLETNEKEAIENIHPDVPSDVSIDFMVTNIEDHLEGGDEILDNLVKHLDSNDTNDMIESIEESNVSNDEQNMSEEIMIPSDCSEINVSLDDIKLQSIENVKESDNIYSEKLKLIDVAETTFGSDNNQSIFDLRKDITVVQNTYKDSCPSDSSHMNEIEFDDTVPVAKETCSTTNTESVCLSKLVSLDECNFPKSDVYEDKNTHNDHSNSSLFSCILGNHFNDTASLEQNTPNNQSKKKFQATLDRYFKVTPKRNVTVDESNNTNSNNNTDKVGEIAMILKEIINTRKSSQVRKSTANFNICSQGEEKPGAIKVYKRKDKKTNLEHVGSVFQVENRTVSTIEEMNAVKVYSRKSRLSHDYTNMQLKIDLKNMQPDPGETEQKFCNCGDYGSLDYYDCHNTYEHIHFWDHRNTDCSPIDIFLIYEDDDSSPIGKPIVNTQWKYDLPKSPPITICWTEVGFSENSCLEENVNVANAPGTQGNSRKLESETASIQTQSGKTKIKKIGNKDVTAKCDLDTQENDGKPKCDLETHSKACNLDMPGNDSKTECDTLDGLQSEFNYKNDKEELVSIVMVLNSSNEDNVNSPTNSNHTENFAPEIEENRLNQKSSVEINRPMSSKTLKLVKPLLQMEQDVMKEKQIEESNTPSTSNVQRKCESKKRPIRKSNISLNAEPIKAKLPTSSRSDKPSTPNMEMNTSKRSSRKSAVSNPDSLNPATTITKMPAEIEQVSKTPRSQESEKTSFKQSGVLSKERSMRSSIMTSRVENSNESILVETKPTEPVETILAAAPKVNTDVLTEATTTKEAASAEIKNKKRKCTAPANEDDRREDTPLSKKASRGSKRDSKRVSSKDTSPDEEAPLSSVRSRKRRIISSGDESLALPTKRKSSIAPKDNVTCGVCKKEVEETQWNDHTTKHHAYLAWKEGDPTLDIADEKSVSRHLTEVLKRLGTLTCSVCGFKRKSVKAYLQHKPRCEESTKIDSKNNSHKVESNELSVNVKCDNDTEVKCGVCHESVTEKSWINHAQKTHDYMAWKDHESPLDLNNEEEVFKHLYAICKLAGSLICKKCGIKRIYVKKYLDHCRNCKVNEFPHEEDITLDSSRITLDSSRITLDSSDVLSQDIYTCALCSKKIDRKKWPQHKMNEHYNVAWIEGENPIDMKNTGNIERLLKEYVNSGHKLACNLCGLKRASRMGFYAHVIVCGKTEEEVEKLKLTCTVCNKKFLAVYESQHYQWHKQAESALLRKTLEKEENEKKRLEILENQDTFVPGGKRRAATKAIQVMQKYKTEIDKSGHVCSFCGFDTNSKELLNQHVQKCKETHEESDDFDESAATELEESDDDSFSGYSENESDGETSFQPKVRIRKAPERECDHTSRYPREVPNITRFMQRSAQEFCQFHLSGKNVYPDWRRSNHVIVPESDVSKYMQLEEKSCKLKINDEWTTMHKLSAKKSKGYCIFVGSAIQCISWAPPLNDGSSNYLAISCHRTMNNPRLGIEDTAAYPGLIQIWDFGTFNKRPEFVLGLAHDEGVVWALDWCPSGAQDPMPEDDTSGGNTRMGLLAVACSSGAAFIYAVPYPPSTSMNQMPILKLRPVVELRLSSRPERKIWQATSLRWSPQNGHALIVVGYSDGTTAYYDLKNDSPLLKTKEDDLTVLFPYYDEKMLPMCVTDLDVYPSMDPESLAGAVCSGSAAGAAATLVASQPTRVAVTVACRTTKFEPLWPAVMLSSDSAIIRSVANEMEWSGQGRSMGSGGIAATCVRCANAIFYQTPLLRLMKPHPAVSDIARRSLASLQVVELKRKTNNEKDPNTSVEPTTYEEAVHHYGIEFKLDKNLPFKSMMIGRDGWTTKFPLADIHGLQFCPSNGHHHRVAIATQAGFVFIVDSS